ncbi:Hypothetical predicted protein [Mytilus galloprovincialis]|uniref:C2H2-type domain-containing protein n=1 Tax=Mytilus galloprovincialis TaxID=29158 RepID=A0A8B6CHE8_MYTGA|nr:Hypothetical predicted protein [Mytilus galloprovincialis]
MAYNCEFCPKIYKYRKNMLRHVKEKHAKTYEYWNCPEAGCSTQFIRREYLFRHLINTHKMEESTARVKAINSSRGDTHRESYYSDVSDDDTILDLLDDFSKVDDTGHHFDVDDFLSTVDENNNIEDKCDDDSINSEMVDIQDDSISFEMADNQSESDDIIIISDVEENTENRIEHFIGSTKEQTVILTFKRTINTVNGCTDFKANFNSGANYTKKDNKTVCVLQSEVYFQCNRNMKWKPVDAGKTAFLPANYITNVTFDESNCKFTVYVQYEGACTAIAPPQPIPEDNSLSLGSILIIM